MDNGNDLKKHNGDLISEMAENSHDILYRDNQPLSYHLKHWKKLGEFIILSRFPRTTSQEVAIWELNCSGWADAKACTNYSWEYQTTVTC